MHLIAVAVVPTHTMAAVHHISAASIVFLLTIVPLKSQVQDSDWWKHSVVYQIYPKSFKDSNNDGVGDIQGVISKLGHLKSSGVTVCWLSPIYKSPQVDDGYDISDFRDVDEIFGTLDDFDQLVANATELGIKVVMDFVPNHSSDQHAWFKLSENRTEGYEDYYVWQDANATTGKEPNNWISVFKYSAWKWSEVRQQYYLHQFTEQQPDLNFNSTAVLTEMEEILTFWLDRGVAGFRIDAVPHMYESGFEDEPRSDDENAQSHEYGYLDHIYTKDQPETFQIIYQWRKLLDDYSNQKGDYSRIIMTESATSISNVMLYYGDEETGELGAHFSFNFNLLGTFTSANGVADSILYWMDNMSANYTANWLTGNHDNDRAATRYGKENVDGFNALIALLPGVMITYNGEEIGQENGEVTYEECQDPSACGEGEEYFYANSRDFARTPFHWDNSTNAGFNEGAKPWLPVSEKYLESNLAFQNEEAIRSHYHFYQELLKLREQPAFVNGTLDVKAVSENVLVLRKSVADADDYAFAFNVGNVSETVNLTEVLSSVAPSLQVVLVSLDSTKNVGDVLDSEALYLDAHEALVLLEVDAELTTNTTAATTTTTTAAITTTTTGASSSTTTPTTTTTTTTPAPTTEASGGASSVTGLSMPLTLFILVVIRHGL